MLACWTILVLALWLPGGLTYPMFKEELPNGDHVPHPCKPNFLWHGVGHLISQGGGPKNPFGEDFANNGNVWNAALCRMDSDGDGLTNGQELGDPDCVWTKGQAPQRITDITHPGVCDPWNEGQCVNKNTWLDCSRDEVFDCEYINDPNVRNITLRFPRTKVPAKETTYVCFNFELPDDQEYHLIATKPLIDNENVMHHMVISTCDSTVQLLSEPQDCIMGPKGCSDSIGGWTLGMTGQCINPLAGYRIGKNGARIVSLQHHWTNPREVDTWYDSSGLTLYYTPKLREYNAATMTLGQMSLSIPPGQPSVVEQGTCSSHCTNKIFKGPIQVFKSQHHMHYLGIRQNVTLKRAGGATMTVSDENPFSYDTPVEHSHDPPVTVYPGDELNTYCTFQSRSRTKTTTYGEGSFEEMCFAFLTYFPAENLVSKTCVQYKDVDMCDVYSECNFTTMMDISNPSTAAMFDKILDNCDPTGACRAECPDAIAEVRAENSCIRDRWNYVYDLFFEYAYDAKLVKFALALDSCEGSHAEVANPTARPTYPPVTTAKPREPAMPMSDPSNIFLNLVKSVDARPLLQNIIMNVNYNNKGDTSNGNDHASTWH